VRSRAVRVCTRVRRQNAFINTDISLPNETLLLCGCLCVRLTTDQCWDHTGLHVHAKCRKTLNCKMKIISRIHEEAQLFISFPETVAHSLFRTKRRGLTVSSPKRRELTVSSPKRRELTVSSYPIPLCRASQRCNKGVCVAAVAAKECVLPLLQQRSVCCRYSHTGSLFFCGERRL
jgi:hypothetical protein